MGTMIAGVKLVPLSILPASDGEVMHAVRVDSIGYRGFGEAYFSTVSYRGVKAWKRHRLMTLNVVVPIGEIRFAIHDDRAGSASFGKTQSVVLSRENYMRLTVPPGLWTGFQGLGRDLNLLLDVTDMIHDPSEVDRCAINAISFDWEKTE